MTEERCSCIKPWERRRAAYIELDGIEHDLCQPIAALINRSDSKLRMVEAERDQLHDALSAIRTEYKTGSWSDDLERVVDTALENLTIGVAENGYNALLREAQAFIIAIDYEIGPRFEQKRGELVRKIEALFTTTVNISTSVNNV